MQEEIWRQYRINEGDSEGGGGKKRCYLVATILYWMNVAQNLSSDQNM